VHRPPATYHWLAVSWDIGLPRRQEFPVHKLIQEFRSAVSREICERLIAKFDHYEKSPVSELMVQDKFSSDGEREGDQRTKEAKCIYLKPSLLQEHDE
jgi:hypothetical protein